MSSANPKPQIERKPQVKGGLPNLDAVEAVGLEAGEVLRALLHDALLQIGPHPVDDFRNRVPYRFDSSVLQILIVPRFNALLVFQI